MMIFTVPYYYGPFFKEWAGGSRRRDRDQPSWMCFNFSKLGVHHRGPAVQTMRSSR